MKRKKAVREIHLADVTVDTSQAKNAVMVE